MKKVKSAPCLMGMGATPAAVASAVRGHPGRLPSWGADGRPASEIALRNSEPPKWKSPIAAPGTLIAPHALRKATATRAIGVPVDIFTVAHDLNGVAKSLQEEMVVEAGLHVVGLEAGSCSQRFGTASQVAPPLADPKAGEVGIEEVEEVEELAMCLATPFNEGNERTLEEQLQTSLEDMAEKQEILFELECIADSLDERKIAEAAAKIGRRKASQSHEDN